MFLGCSIDISPGCATAAKYTHTYGINRHILHVAEVNHHGPIFDRVARVAVAPTPNGNLKAVVASKLDSRGNIGRVRTSGNHCRSAIHLSIPHGTCLVVGGVAGHDHGSTKVHLQRIDITSKCEGHFTISSYDFCLLPETEQSTVPAPALSMHGSGGLR